VATPRAGRAGPLLRGICGDFAPRFVPKDPAGNRTAEQIDDAVTGASYNNMNQLTSQQAGGALVFKGTVSEPATVTVGGAPATVTTDNRFEGQATVPEGTGQVDVVATDPSGNVRTSTYEVNQAGSPKSFTYDLNGNMTSDGTRTYEWDAENRLVVVKEGATTIASYTYNAGGLRASKTVGGATTIYMLDGPSVVEERPSTGGLTKHFQGPWIDNVLASQDAAGTVTYYTRDHLGSIRDHVSVAGTVTLRRDYDPWGNVLAGRSTGGYAFTGREWESGVGLHYYRARYYDPAAARFASPDPIRLFGGFNFYSYVGGNPVSRVDPGGLRQSGGGGSCCPDIKSRKAEIHCVLDKIEAGRAIIECFPEGAQIGGFNYCYADGTSDPIDIDYITRTNPPCLVKCSVEHEKRHAEQCQRSRGNQAWAASERAAYMVELGCLIKQEREECCED
jgi:RHS repeat-associated protein